MKLPPLIHPHVYADPTLDTAIWFLHLRWSATFGQLITLLFARFVLNIELPMVEISGLIATTAVTNLAYWFWLSRLHRSGLQLTDRLPSDLVIFFLILIDVLDLTGLLYLSGGLANPFWLFYFVNITMAAVIVTPAWAWNVWAFTVAGVVVLLKFNPRPIGLLSQMHEELTQAGSWTMPQTGYLVSFATSSAIITYFATILTGQLRQREQAIKEAEEARSRNRQLESLATLAAGAAHELASPLSTIAVVSKELGRTLEKIDSPKNVMNDIGLIRSELKRCREILDRMTTATGDAAGEQLRSISIEQFVEETLLGVRDAVRVNVVVETKYRQQTNLLPVQAVAQAVRNLVQNALDASTSPRPVSVEATIEDRTWIIDVIDQGAGMPTEVLERLGQPFFTTKEPGKGMGLGVYLAMNVLRRLGGSVDFISQPNVGTRVRVRLPHSG